MSVTRHDRVRRGPPGAVPRPWAAGRPPKRFGQPGSVVRLALLVALAWVAFFLTALTARSALAQSTSPRPPRLDCRTEDCAGVLPGAVRFEPAPGQAPYALGFDAAGELVGWVVLSTDVVDIDGYSGKPLVTLVGLTKGGLLGGAELLEHHEPILLTGIPPERLQELVAWYAGKPVSANLVAGKDTSPGAVSVDMISGATVTVQAEHRTILESARRLGRAVGVVETSVARPGRFVEGQDVWTWQELLDEGALGHLVVTRKELDARHEEDEDKHEDKHEKDRDRDKHEDKHEDHGAHGHDDEVPLIDLYFGLADAPQVGRALLGDAQYAAERQRLADGEHLLVVLNAGSDSYTGSAFVRGGAFDRLSLQQGLTSITFRDRDYSNISGTRIPGAPPFHQAGVFVIRKGLLDPGAPFDLVFLASRYTGEGGIEREYETFRAPFRLPRSVYQPLGTLGAGMPWRDAWKVAPYKTVIAAAAFLVVGLLFIARRWLTRSLSRLKRLHVVVLLATAGGLGFWLRSQPSVTQVLTVADSAQGTWRWSLFLSEPTVFVSWVFIALTTLVWGRGVFCGWLCPYGALTELLYRGARWVKLPRLELPERWHRKVRYLRYLVLVGLIAAFLVSPDLGERLAEVEPFKTTFFVAPWTRTAGLIAWWGFLLALSLVVFRPFCRYLCPLGAALAAASSVRFSGPLRRRFCSSCRVCTRGCEPRAIRDDGVIDPRECLSCMECEARFHDETVCPPLIGIERLTRRASAAPEDQAQLAKLRRAAEPRVPGERG